MKTYRYKRDLDGVSTGDERDLSADEAGPLILSEAIEEVTGTTADAAPAPKPQLASEPEAAPPLTPAPVPSVSVSKPVRAKKVQH